MKSSGRGPTVPLDGAKDDAAKLELESTGSQTLRGVRLPTGFDSSGYNPYDTIPGTSTSATGQHRIENMRRLSEWIRMKRTLSRNGKD
jgi:hypothetical protein